MAGATAGGFGGGTAEAERTRDRVGGVVSAVFAFDEIDAGIQSLKTRYPGKVSDAGMVLAGFSLGAILIPRMVEMASGTICTPSVRI